MLERTKNTVRSNIVDLGVKSGLSALETRPKSRGAMAPPLRTAFHNGGARFDTRLHSNFAVYESLGN